MIKLFLCLNNTGEKFSLFNDKYYITHSQNYDKKY